MSDDLVKMAQGLYNNFSNCSVETLSRMLALADKNRYEISFYNKFFDETDNILWKKMKGSV